MDDKEGGESQDLPVDQEAALAAHLEYATMKTELATRHRSDREAYIEAKSGFVRDMLAHEIRRTSGG